jgi:hypothetical protein
MLMISPTDIINTKCTNKNTKLENRYREKFNVIDVEFSDIMRMNTTMYVI